MEYKLLEYLALHQGQVVSQADITEHLYDFESDKFSNVVEVYIALAAIVVAHSYDTFSDLIVAQTDRVLASAARSVQTVMDDPAFAGDHATRVRIILAAEMPSKGEQSDGDEQPQTAACVWFDGQDAIDTGSQACVAMLEQLSELANPHLGASVSFDMATPHGHFRGIWMYMPLADGALNIAIVRSTTRAGDRLAQHLWFRYETDQKGRKQLFFADVTDLADRIQGKIGQPVLFAVVRHRGAY